MMRTTLPGILNYVSTSCMFGTFHAQMSKGIASSSIDVCFSTKTIVRAVTTQRVYCTNEPMMAQLIIVP